MTPKPVPQRIQHDPLKAYSYHKVTPNIWEDIALIRKASRALAEIILSIVPDSQEKSVALTDLNKVRMNAILALSMHSEGSEMVADDKPQQMSGTVEAEPEPVADPLHQGHPER